MADVPAGDKPEDTPDPKVFNRPEDEAGKKALDEERKARRDAEKSAKDLAARLKELEDKDKSETDRLREENVGLKQQVSDAEAKATRFEVAAEKGVKPRWLTGTTREELEAAADEYLTDHPSATGAGPAPSKPTEALSGGGDPTEEPDETDPRKLAEQIPRS